MLAVTGVSVCRVAESACMGWGCSGWWCMGSRCCSCSRPGPPASKLVASSLAVAAAARRRDDPKKARNNTRRRPRRRRRQWQQRPGEFKVPLSATPAVPIVTSQGAALGPATQPRPPHPPPTARGRFCTGGGTRAASSARHHEHRERRLGRAPAAAASLLAANCIARAVRSHFASPLDFYFKLIVNRNLLLWGKTFTVKGKN